MNKMDVCATLIQMCVEDMIDARSNDEFKSKNIEVVDDGYGTDYRITKIVRSNEGAIRIVIVPE